MGWYPVELVGVTGPEGALCELGHGGVLLSAARSAFKTNDLGLGPGSTSVCLCDFGLVLVIMHNELNTVAVTRAHEARKTLRSVRSHFGYSYYYFSMPQIPRHKMGILH